MNSYNLIVKKEKSIFLKGKDLIRGLIKVDMKNQWKSVKLYELLGKCKLMPQWDNTTHLWEWQKFKTDNIKCWQACGKLAL